jgi:uncharacterized protein
LTDESTKSVPVAATERITSIDTLRGVAVLGILVMNIYGFAMPFIAYQNPLAMGGTEWYNIGTWFFTHIFFDQKFLTIFALLFGAGLVMMATRADARGAKYGANWYRRNFWLLVIGAMHGYLLWFGDILFHYALMGMLIYPLRNRSPRTLIITAAFLLSIGLLMQAGGGAYMTQLQADGLEFRALQDAGETLSEEQEAKLEEWDASAAFLKPPEQQVAEDMAAYTGSWKEGFEQRKTIVVMMQTQGTLGFIIWRVGGLTLLGMALMKLGILSAQRSGAYYRKMMLIGYGLGKSAALKNLMRRFTAVVRKALTNNLMHTIVMTTIFYGYGLGFYGQVPRFFQMGFVVAMLGFQLWFSTFWLDRYRFGPAEWCWRSLSYWKLQPMRKAD